MSLERNGAGSHGGGDKIVFQDPECPVNSGSTGMPRIIYPVIDMSAFRADMASATAG